MSSYGSIGGVPVAVLGLLFFGLVLILVWVARGRTGKPEAAVGSLLLLSTVALAMVVYLAVASFFVLGQVCPLCLATYVAVIGLFATSVRAMPPMSALPARAIDGMRSLVSTPGATVVTTLFVIGAVGLIAGFPKPEQRPYVPPLQPLAESERTELERWFDLQPKVDLPFPHDQAKVVIVKFNDYQCPPCRGTYLRLRAGRRKVQGSAAGCQLHAQALSARSEVQPWRDQPGAPRGVRCRSRGGDGPEPGNIRQADGLVLHAPERTDAGNRTPRGRRRRRHQGLRRALRAGARAGPGRRVDRRQGWRRVHPDVLHQRTKGSGHLGISAGCADRARAAQGVAPAVSASFAASGLDPSPISM